MLVGRRLVWKGPFSQAELHEDMNGGGRFARRLMPCLRLLCLATLRRRSSNPLRFCFSPAPPCCLPCIFYIFYVCTALCASPHHVVISTSRPINSSKLQPYANWHAHSS